MKIPRYNLALEPYNLLPGENGKYCEFEDHVKDKTKAITKLEAENELLKLDIEKAKDILIQNRSGSNYDSLADAIQDLINEVRKVNIEKGELKELLFKTLYDYAWYKDGLMYVGCGIRTYKKAREKLEQALKEE